MQQPPGAGRAGGGPTLRDVLPALALTAAALTLPLALLLLLFTGLDWWTCLVTALISVTVGLAALRLHRRRSSRPAPAAVPAPVAVPEPPARPPLPNHPPRRPTAAQIADLPDAAYRQVVANLLQRDGWQVREVPVGDDVHLVGAHHDGSQIGLRCLRGELSDQDGQDSAAPLRPVGAPPAGAPTGALWLMVSTGSWSRSTVRWAARSNIRLVDAPLLDRWSAGEDLADLLGLHADPVHAAR